MAWDTRVSSHDFPSKDITPKKEFLHTTAISESSKYVPNLQFLSSESRIGGFKHLLQRSRSTGKHYIYSKTGVIPNAAWKKWYTTIFCKLGFEPKSHSTQNTIKVHHPILSKLSPLCPKVLVPKTYPYVYGLEHSPYSRLSVRNLSYNQDSSNPSFVAQIRHFIKRLRDNPVLDLIGIGIGIILAFSLETIPYSERTHITFFPPRQEKWIGDIYLKCMRLSILPEKHPDSIRVRSISNQLIEALEKDLQIERRKVSKTSSDVDDKVIVKEPRQRRNKYSVKHLEALDWEVMVVKSRTANAFCLPGGKIVVFTGLLERLKSDEEIATVISHEVGHVVARHAADRAAKILILSYVLSFVMSMGNSEKSRSHYADDLMNKLIKFVVNYPWSRRREKEADYIGILLMATAGYNPQEAPKVYEMFDKISRKKLGGDIFSTHPSGKNRAEALSKNEVMEEANFRYSRTIKLRENDFKDLSL